MRVRRHVLTAMLMSVAAVAACSAGSGPATLDEATRMLSDDAGLLVDGGRLRLSAVEQVEDGSCVPGQARRFLRGQSDLPADSTGLMDRLQAMGYAKIVDDLDLRDDGRDVAVLSNPATRLTFELTVVSGERPGVEVVGKTTCYAVE